MNVKPGLESGPDDLLPDGTNLVVDLVCTNGTDLKETVRAQNVSAGGARVATEKIWPPGELVLLSTHETEEPVPVRVVNRLSY